MSRFLGIGILVAGLLISANRCLAATETDKNAQGIAAYRAHRLDEAEKTFSDAIREEEASHGDSELLSTYLTNISLVYEAAGHKAEAEKSKLRAAKILAKLRGLPDPEEVAKEATAAAQFSADERLIKNRISQAERAADKKAQALALKDLVLLYKKAEKYTQAESTMRKILAIVQQDVGNQPDRDYAYLLRIHASILTKLGREQEADKHLLQAAQMEKRADELDAQFASEEPRLKKALQQAEAKPNNAAGIIKSLTELVTLYSKSRSNKHAKAAVTFIGEAIQKIEKQPMTSSTEADFIGILGGYANCLQASGDTINAARYREKSAKLSQESRGRILAQQQAKHNTALTAFNKGGSCSISGKIWLSFKSGDSKIQRGKEIILCDDGILGELRAPGEMGIFPLRRYMLGPLPEIVQKHLLKSGESDADGQYSFTSIPNGRYCLLSIAYSDEYSAYWAVPVTVKGQESMDLRNSNLYDMVGY